METQKQMIERMIKDNLTMHSLDKGFYETFKSLTPAQIYQLILRCGKQAKLDYSYSNEPLYYIMRDSRIILVSATAGAGKTTLTCNKVDREIRFIGRNPRRICMLSFNNDSVQDMKRKMLAVMENNNLVTRQYGIYMDEKSLPNIRSLNSLTYNLVDQYKDYWHLSKIDIVSNEDATIEMSKTLNALSKDIPELVVSEELVSNCLSIYDLLNETCSTLQSIHNMSAVVDTGLSIKTLDTIITAYKSKLQIKGKFHHSDTARLVLERCEVDKNFRYIVENLFDLIVVDELQDISESVFRLIKIMVNTKNRLIAIGDGDQSIYGFKGARPDTCYKFKEDFPEAELCMLSVNRRCAENILNYAKEVISGVHHRIPQELKAIREGGEVTIHHYSDTSEVIDILSEYLNGVPKDQLGKMCIGFRKNVTCYYIAQKLMEHGIPFRVRPDMMPGADKLSGHLKNLFSILKSPSNLSLAFQHLYKVTPMRKMSDIDREKLVEELEDFMEENDLEYFYELPSHMLPLRNNRGQELDAVFKELEKASKLVRKRGTMKQILAILFPIFEKYFWSFTRAVTSFQPELEEMVRDIYSQDETYLEFQHRKKEMEDRIKRYTDKGYGIKLSSFHSLKGLEFDEVFLVELDANNLPLIKCSESATDEELMSLVDEELRLFYVAVTRAKNKLHTFWSSVSVSPVEKINESFEINLSDLNLNLDTDVDEEPEDLDLVLSLDLDEEFVAEKEKSFTEVLDSISDVSQEIPVEINFDKMIEQPVKQMEPVMGIPKENIEQQQSHNTSEDIATDTAMNDTIFKPHFDFSTLEENIEEVGLEKNIHLREDFVDVKNGNELQNVLGFICNVIEAKGAT